MARNVVIDLPRWAIGLYAALAIILIPWIADLADDLPARHVARHWPLLWVGFDIMLLCMIVVTVIFMLKRSIWVIVSASVLATFFLVDVWFDVLTAKPGLETRESMFFGVIEVSLALLTFRLVYRLVKHLIPEKNVRFKARYTK